MTVKWKQRTNSRVSAGSRGDGTIPLESTPRSDSPAASGAVPEAPSSGSVRRSRITARRREANQRLLVEIRALGAALRELIDRYEIRVGAHLAELELLVEGGDREDGGRPLTTRTALAMLEEIGSTRIKPRKGKTKDLVRLDSLVERLADHVPPER